MAKLTMKRTDFEYLVERTIRKLRELLLDFIPYGLSEEILDNYENRIALIKQMPANDTENFSLGIDLDRKNRMREALLEDIRMMAVRVLAKYGKNSIANEQFGMKNMTSFSDEVLESKARAAYSFLNERISELEDYGLTPAVLASFLDSINNFADARLTWLNARANRLITTNKRLELSKELYDEIQKWMAIGRLIYRKKSRVFYEYFVTYGTRKSYKLFEISGFNFDIENKKISWETQPNATSYQLQSSVDNDKFVEIYSGEENEFVLPILPKIKTYYKVRPRNSKGFGEFSDVIEYELN